MGKRSLFLFLLAGIIINVHSQNVTSRSYSSWSGTIRMGGGVYGTVYSYCMPVTVGLLQAFKVTSFEVSKWADEQHTFLRYFNIGGDILIPNWSMSASNLNIELLRGDDDNFLNDPVNQYTYYIGYYFNWTDKFSRLGLFFGADYEWKNFYIHYPYPNVSHNKIHSLVPTIGIRYRLIGPMRELGGFPFNIVFEGGMSYVINTKYDNTDGYGTDALNNGFRPMLGVAVTTNRFGSIHFRWTKDLFYLFNNDYSATEGPLFRNGITNDFSCLQIGWAIFI